MDNSSSDLPLSETSSPSEQTQPSSLRVIAQELGLNQIQRHLFLCADQTKPKCCSKKLSLDSWNYLKTRLKELGLDNPISEEIPYIFRTKANCLRVCQSGPILLVYPDGIWYRHATPEVIERIIQEHLLQNKVVEDYVFESHPLNTKKFSET